MRQSLLTTAAVAAVFFASGAWTPQQGWLAAGLSAAQLVPLLWSRRAPALVLVVVTVATAGHLLLDQPRNTMYVPVLLALHSTPQRWLAAAAALVTGAAVFPAKGPVDGTLLAVTISAVAWLLGAERRRALADRAERAARRLHDTLAQTTAVMLVQAETLRAVGDLTDADRARLDTLLAAGRGALTLVRRTLDDLRDDADRAPDLAEVLARLRTAGLVLDRDPVLPELPRPVRELAERFVAETAVNALRHNGPGVRLRLDVDAGERVRITARNPLKGTSSPGGGYGLAGLAEQARAAGGTLTHGPRDGEWVVSVELPAAVPRSRTGSRAA
ncbi:histidine kinase [Amycolatopsis rifamycinica]|uniref:histidine kinase n=1 Tax=Amycolatopsis rifamycinica TaxID=287986 RepID=A0A066UIY4_9PSEU|nr:histidine kinase [Amycolatopsis rifamycinica]KDN24158.1 histidine kinase [Amycolatopsis rifamycinica]